LNSIRLKAMYLFKSKMRLYQRNISGKALLFLSISILLAACGGPRLQQGEINVQVALAGETQSVSVPAGSTVRDAVEALGIEVGLLDRSEPSLFTVLSDNAVVLFVQVQEEFVIEEVVVPYQTETLQNETLPEGERRLIQPGQNGLQEVTFRVVYEDGVEVSRNPVKTVLLREPSQEIVMVGSQALFATQAIPGRLVYLAGNNAWVMETNTSIRRPVVTTGDLDGRIFTLSPDGTWLLYTRSSSDEDAFNSLWVARVDDDSGLTIDLKVNNVIHFANWAPGNENTIMFSTAEPTDIAPGWSANNDLQSVIFSENGWASQPQTILEPNSGGVYGWWGTTFSWSPDGEQLAFARPDGIGLIDLEGGAVTKVLDVTPYETGSDWVWMPNVSWGPDNSYLYTINHAPQEGLVSQEQSPLFDLTVVSLIGGGPVRLVPQTGMFAYPTLSPSLEQSSGERRYMLAYLQALAPTQSDDSGYQLVVVDRDGSNPQIVFPPLGAPGLEPQRLAWAPERLGEGEAFFVAFRYLNNLWIVDLNTGEAQQLTGDGLATEIDWK
jgi:Tol biopolymer transport system component